MGTVHSLSIVPAAAADDAPHPSDADGAARDLKTKTRSVMTTTDAWSGAEGMVNRIARNSGLRKWAVWAAMFQYCADHESEFVGNLAEYLDIPSAQAS